MTEPTTDPRTAASPATDAVAALLDELVRAGLEHIVVSPGSRSQALALVAAELERSGRATVHVRVDERVAGFLALGLARESGRPVAVVVTSGTAVANLVPAVLEAHHAGVPLLLLTADRPPELRGVGANQTTRQPGFFGTFTQYAADAPVPTEADADGTGSATYRELARTAWQHATGGLRGPVHLNLPLRDPLAGELPPWWGSDPRPVVADEPEEARVFSQGTDSVEQPAPAWDDRRTLVVAGADAGPLAEALAHDFGWPLLAEIVSGARFGRNVVHGYRELLRDPRFGGSAERVVVVGHPTLSREVAALLSRDDVEVVALRGAAEPVNLNGATTPVTLAELRASAPAGDRAWLDAWRRASAERAVDLSADAPDAAGLASADARERRAATDAELAVLRAPITRESLVDAVWRASWPHDRVVFGSSRLVRVADDVLPGKKVPVHANRGLAGIDGTVATAQGIAIASQADGSPGVTRVLLGDLTMLHDVGALLMPADEQEPRIQVVVGNDGGGTIFDGLEVAKTASPEDMRRVQYTPQHVRLEHLALAYGWEYTRVSTRGALDQVLARPIGGRQLIEVPLTR